MLVTEYDTPEIVIDDGIITFVGAEIELPTTEASKVTVL
jgi:hypothetical protein